MSHLVNYEEAKGPRAKALAAIEVFKRKNAKHLAWSWAEKAQAHAREIDVEVSIGEGRYPDTDALEKALRDLEDS